MKQSADQTGEPGGSEKSPKARVLEAVCNFLALAAQNPNHDYAAAAAEVAADNNKKLAAELRRPLGD